MKIAFCNFPWWEQTEKGLRYGIRAGSRWPFTQLAHCMPGQFTFGGYLPYPFFMGYAASYIAREVPGSEVVLRDSLALRESYTAFMEWIVSWQPDFIVVESATPSWGHDRKVIEVLANVLLGCGIIVTGTITTTKAAEALDTIGVVAVVQGEYEKGLVKVLNGATGIIPHDLLTKDEMNAAPFPLLPPDTATHYWDPRPMGQKPPQLQLWSSRGCPYKCLSGDTAVNTVHGMIPIRELAETCETVGVFTYDPAEKRAKICTARNILKLGENERLVRVLFDDGSHIDCTPDHRFLAFKWGNQSTGEREWVSEAADLRPGTHVRALRFEPTGPQKSRYTSAAWSRRGRATVHRMVAEWKIERRLRAGEVVHHIDRNRLNNDPDNLAVLSGTRQHTAEHPEIAQRMREANPAAGGLPAEWLGKIAAGNRGKVRTQEAREKYRQAAIRREALKTPEQKRMDAQRMHDGASVKRPWLKRSRDAEGRFEPELVNHRVVSVEPLDGLHDVYCLEVPETGWFYANNVLVKNCCFCAWPATMTGNDPDGTGRRAVRTYSTDYMREFLFGANVRHGYCSIYDDSDTFNLIQRHTVEMCEVYQETGLPWSAMCRADTIDRDTWRLMKDSGCFGVKIGFESGSQRVIDHIVNKRLNLAEAADTARFLRSIGLTVHGTFTVGLPGETAEEVQQTIDFIQSLYQTGGLDSHQLSGTAVIEGTPLGSLRDLGPAGRLAAYDQAVVDGRFIAATDGQLKIEGMLS